MFYRCKLGESFSFRITNMDRGSELFLENLDVTVHDYKAISPTAAANMSDHFNDIILVEMDREERRKPPWHFPAKFFLGDPGESYAPDWGRDDVSLPGGRTRTFFVKVAAKHRGVYTYTVDLLVRRGAHEIERIPLVKKRRSCAFTGMDEPGDDRFRKELQRTIHGGKKSIPPPPKAETG